MTMELIGPNGEEHYTHPGWRMVLDLVLKFGWKPAGATVPADEGDKGSRSAFFPRPFRSTRSSGSAARTSSTSRSSSPSAGREALRSGRA